MLKVSVATLFQGIYIYLRAKETCKNTQAAGINKGIDILQLS